MDWVSFIVLRVALAFAALAALKASFVGAAELESRGYLGSETRVFLPDDDDRTKEAGVSAAARLQVDASGDSPFAARLRVFTRHDSLDRDRSVLFAEEAWAEWRGGLLRLRVGVDMITWTALEAFHPADVLNSRNFDSNVENFEKIGEPMAALRLRLGQGDVAVYALPVFGGARLPSPNSRLSLGPPGVPLGAALYSDRQGNITEDRFGVQWAARATQTIGDADVGVHVLQHTDRLRPLVLMNPATGDVQPLYQYATEIGWTYSHILGAVIGKFEGVHRRYTAIDDMTTYGPLPNRNATTLAAGIEYGMAHESGSESTFLMEGQIVLGPDKAMRRLLEFFQRDVLVGYRLAFNDAASRTAMVGVMVDLERPQEFLISTTYGQRVGETWSVDAGLRFLRLPPLDPNNPIGFERWNNAHQAFVHINRHF